MSGDANTGSRKAQSSSDAELANEISMMNRENLKKWVETPGNLENLKANGGTPLATLRKKWDKLGLDPVALKGIESVEVPQAMEVGKAPAVIKELSSSMPALPPESMDIEYLTQAEYDLGTQFNTLRTRIVHDPHINTESHTGPWVDVCVGRNPETRKLQVVRMPAKEIPILPDQVVHYRGSVVMDKMAVRKEDVVLGNKRHGYVFDRFFEHNGKKYPRCCLVEDRTHQASLIYRKAIDKRSRRAMAVLKRLPGTDEPAYAVIGAKEADYRDLKRLFERYFLGQNDRGMDDPALGKLIDEHMPERDSLSL